MAIPTTHKECTTRRIAALIIGLWDKIKNAFLLKTSRGTANGVASLDANGKVPSSQLPNFGSGTVTSVATGVGLRGGTITDSGTISIDVPRNPSSDVNSPFPTSSTINAMAMQEYNGASISHCPTNDWWHILSSIGSDSAYVTQLAQKVTGDYTPDLCVRVKKDNSWSDWLSTRDASWIRTGTISSDRLPEITNKRNFPKLNFFKNGDCGASAQFIKVATITCGVRHLNHPFIFRCLTRSRFMYTIYFMPESSDTTKPGIKHFLVEIPVEDTDSTANVRLTYDDSGANRVYTLWFNPGSWSNVSTVLESEDSFAQFVNLTSEQYSTSLTNSITPKFIRVPVIEHVTSIPTSPTVGTIYAL